MGYLKQNMILLYKLAYYVKCNILCCVYIATKLTNSYVTVFLVIWTFGWWSIPANRAWKIALQCCFVWLKCLKGQSSRKKSLFLFRCIVGNKRCSLENKWHKNQNRLGWRREKKGKKKKKHWGMVISVGQWYSWSVLKKLLKSYPKKKKNTLCTMILSQVIWFICYVLYFTIREYFTFMLSFWFLWCSSSHATTGRKTGRGKLP